MRPKQILRCERMEAARCSRLQCRFCACFLAVACVCVFVVACIAMPTAFVPSAVVMPRRSAPSTSHGLLYTARLKSSEEKAAASPPIPSRIIRNRKLLAYADTAVDGAQYGPAAAPHAGTYNRTREYQVQRMGPGVEEGGRPSPSCSTEDIAIVQGEMGPMPDGIPSFAVQILNLCLGGCPIADIHVSCGWFASATLVNPALFKRVGFDDCLVKEGHALAAGETLTFQYANSFQYPFSLSSASFTCP